MNDEDRKEAFLRASLDGGRPAIFALHKRNLKLLQENPTQYNSLRSDIITYAKLQKMTFAFDEIHQMSETFVGQFLHSATIVKGGVQVFQLTDQKEVTETEWQTFLVSVLAHIYDLMVFFSMRDCEENAKKNISLQCLEIFNDPHHCCTS